MSTAMIALIAVGGLAILAALYLASRKQGAQEREDRSLIASEHAEEAERNRLDAEELARASQLAQLRADAHADHAREIDPDLGEEDLDERHEVSDGEREGLYTGERPPVNEAEPARHRA